VARIFIVGCSGHAGVVLDVIEKEGRHTVAGIVDTFAAPGTQALGLTVLGGELDLPRLMNEHHVSGGIVAIGDNFRRHLVVERIRAAAPAFDFVTALHPSAQIGTHVEIGRGTVVMAGAVINPHSSIGEHCIVNTASSIDHDNVFGNFSSIAPGAATGGNVRVGAFSALSLQSGVIHGRAVGAHTVIGAGAIVVRDIPDYSVAYGTPARVIRSRTAGEQYL
jgi:sugar O-acyltransferase (sialic acid O-acetyltransferase NeuD family)